MLKENSRIYMRKVGKKTRTHKIIENQVGFQINDGHASILKTLNSGGEKIGFS